MSLVERFFPVMKFEHNFFDQVFRHVQKEMAQMDDDMLRMRQQMFQLLPEPQMDVSLHEITPKVPIVEEKGETKLKLDFNVQKFKPEEVEVKLVGNNILQVRAEHSESSSSGSQRCMYLRTYSLPDGVDRDNIKPMLTKDGVLTIEAPAPALKRSERLIPIEYKNN